MAGWLRGGLATGLLVLCLSAPAQGFGFRWRSAYYPSYYSHSYYSHSYYAPAYYAPRMSHYPAIYYSPQPAYPYAYQHQCVPVMPAGHYPSYGFQPYAQPRPAPASTREPPTDKPAPPGRSPKITESRYAADTATDKQPPASKDHCKVGFWNLTGRDVSLLVDGQSHFLRKDHAMTLDLTRQFAWKMDQGELRSERVPADQRTHEILLRPKTGR
jgi:hypothetical protein